MTTNQLTTHTRIVALDMTMLRLAQVIREATAQLESAVIERAALTGDVNYMAWIVCKDGMVQTKTEVFAKLPAPPKPIAVKPIAPLGLLTVDYVIESLKREKARKMAEAVLER